MGLAEIMAGAGKLMRYDSMDDLKYSSGLILCKLQVAITEKIDSTNLPFADWPQIFGGDDRLAGALIDRLTHRINQLEILGESYRFNSNLKKKKEDAIKLND